MPELGGNLLLTGLPPAELAILEPQMERVALRAGTVLVEAGHPAPFVYFPINGVIALVGATAADGPTVEVAVVGPEGVVSMPSVLGARHLPFSAVVQIDTEAWRIRSELVASQVGECGELHTRLLIYALHLIVQIAQSAVCNRFHNARQRLARWLAMTADRTDTREWPLTHEFMSALVGGPRSAVTEAAGALRDSGALDYRRGTIQIKDVERLRSEACECYDFTRSATQKPRR